jgi:hypothetical protein
VNALTNQEVGEYLNENFVSTFQKVGAFRIVNGQKQGGNVASYFCTPEGRVLHLVVGAVDAPTLLREASWVVETWKMAQLVNQDEGADALFGQAHADRLRQGHGVSASSEWAASAPDMDSALNRRLAPQGRVHLLLAEHPLVKIEKIYQLVFKNILNEQVSTSPVMEGTPRNRHQRFHEPTPEEIREQAQQERLHRARNNPPRQEILSAKSLNVLLVDLQQLDDRDIRAPDQVLTQELLQQINVTTGRGSTQIDLLKQTRLTWPVALRGSQYDNERQLLNSLVGKAKKQSGGMLSRPIETSVLNLPSIGREIGAPSIRAAHAKLDPALVREMVEAIENLEALLALNIKDLPAPRHVEAKRFLRHLKEELEVLQQPDAGFYVNGTYAARGKSVQELIRHMSAHGLRFAPAQAGSETSYLALHHALAAYDLKAHAAANEMIIDPIEPIAAE